MDGSKIIKFYRSVNNEQNGKNTDSNSGSSDSGYRAEISKIGGFMKRTYLYFVVFLMIFAAYFIIRAV